MASCPLLAQSGHELVQRTCPLSGVKRTCPFAAHMSAFDPKRIFNSLGMWTIPMRWIVIKLAYRPFYALTRGRKWQRLSSRFLDNGKIGAVGCLEFGYAFRLGLSDMIGTKRRLGQQ